MKKYKVTFWQRGTGAFSPKADPNPISDSLEVEAENDAEAVALAIQYFIDNDENNVIVDYDDNHIIIRPMDCDWIAELYSFTAKEAC